MELRAVKGMNDILPGEIERWHALESAFMSHVALYGYQEARTPMLEHTSLFARQIGETTDVVEKEMYSFTRHGDDLTVRPEGTAGLARAYVEHNIHAKEPITRWCYVGPMFRGERPAKGRYRQFYQAGCELYGDAGPFCDAEMIEMLVTFLKRIGITGVSVHINSLGSGGTRERYRDALVGYFTPIQSTLSEDSQRRLAKNPLRILDSKDPRDKEAAAGAPSILGILADDDRAHWDGLRTHLDALGVPYVVDATLVRGLDYYTRTLFELRATDSDLGAQNTLLGGGRYDNMIEGLGGPKVPAIGFAAGIERLLISTQLAGAARAPRCFVAPLGNGTVGPAAVLARDLRAAGIGTDMDGRGTSMRAMLRRADNLGARLCIIVGETELSRGVVQLKDLSRRTQQDVPLDAAVRVATDLLAASPTPSAGEGAP
ncbi:MAG: histidine--tRNA ligase [Polyangiaceae bacterium]|nr:histidine--tRNA ligase [Polyangiaceae bacterium]